MLPEHRQFLRFSWGKTIYEFTCLPFGLSSAPWAFTKILRPAVAFLRLLGIRMVVYLDDMLIMNTTKEGLNRDVEMVTMCLIKLGFLINWEKSL